MLFPISGRGWAFIACFMADLFTPFFMTPMKTSSYLRGRTLLYILYLAFAYALLCLWRPAQAQDIKPLALGDTVPAVEINGFLNQQGVSAKLSDYRGKLLIIDFWATWCAPCVMMLPRIDSLQKQFEGRVHFLSVTAEPASKVNAFLDKYQKKRGKRIQVPTVVSDTVLHKLFYHTSIPHYVWIDQAGVVRAVTELREITAGKITAFLEKSPQRLVEKKDERSIAYTVEKPFLAGGNGGDGSALVYHSVLAKYTPGLRGGFSWKTDSVLGRRITVTNCARIWLYRIAYGKPGSWFYESNVRLETRDSAKISSSRYGQAYKQWLSEGNGFCYEIIVPKPLAEKTNALMQQQLSDFFPEYSARVVTETRRCLVLVRQSKGALISSGSGAPVLEITRMGWRVRNVSPGRLVERLNQLQSHSLTIVDQTGFDGNIDLDLLAGLSDLTAANRELARYGLAFVEKQVDQEILVISDNPATAKR